MLKVEDALKTEEYMIAHQAFTNKFPTIAQIWIDELDFEHGLALQASYFYYSQSLHCDIRWPSLSCLE